MPHTQPISPPLAAPRVMVPTAQVSTAARLGAAVVAAACLSLLIVSARLDPSSAGHGTHTQLGLPPCGWAIYFGKPCATCGMTTAFAHAAHFQLWSSFKAQPMGMLLALATAVGFWAAAHVAVTGSRVGIFLASLLTPRLLWAVAALTLAAWTYKFVTWTP